MIKRFLLAALVVTLAFTSCATSYNEITKSEKVEAVEYGINLLDNPGLECSNKGENWGFSDSVFVSSSVTHSGENSIVIIPKGGVEYFYNVVTADCDKDGHLVVSAWIYLSSAWDAESVSFILERQMKAGRNETYTVTPEKVSGWQRVSIEVPSAGENSTQHLVVRAECDSVSAPVYFDDFAIVSLSEKPLNYIRNSSFTDGESSWNGFVHGYGLDGNGAVLDLSTSKKSISQSTAFWAQKRPVFNADLDMKFSAFVTLDSDEEAVVRLKVESKPSNTVQYRDYVLKPDSGWVEIDMTAEAVLGTEEAVYTIEGVEDSGKIHIDNVRLVAVALDKNSGDGSNGDIVVQAFSSGNVLRNGSLEDLNSDGSVTHWDVWPGNPKEGTRDYEVITDGAYDSDKALKINLVPGNAQAVYQYCVADTAGKFDFNQAYTFSCKLKFEGVTTLDGKGVTIGIKRRGADGNEYNVYQRIDETDSDWTEFSVTAPKVGVEIIQYDVILDLGAGYGSVSMDDCQLLLAQGDGSAEVLSVATVVEGNVLRNSSLETLNPDGSVTHWDVWPGNPDEGTRDYEVITEDVYDSSKALKINLVLGNAQAVYQYCVMDTAGKFDFNQAYTFSCMLKLDSVMTLDGKGVTIGIKRRGADGNEYNVYQRIDETDSDWTEFSVTAPKVDVEIVQYDVILDMGAGFGSVTMDDCRLMPADDLESGELVLSWE